MQIGRCSVAPGVWFGSRRISIGDGTSINYGCMFNTTSAIRIGSHCDIGMQVTFVTSTHEIGTHRQRAGAASSEEIKIGDGVWIGARVTILPGVTIDNGAVVAAGSLVNRNLDADTLYAGVPAKPIRRI
jgi:maltose O-acetyltransferase